MKGRDLEHMDSVLHRRKVIMLSQSPPMFKGSIRENLLAGLRFQEKTLPAEPVLEDVLKRVGMDKSLDGPSSTLSGGEKQRLALARVMLLDPDTFLLDEPSSSLDELSEQMIIEMISSFVKDNKKSMVMVTHSKKIAQKYSDDAIDLMDKKTGRQPWIR
jgi:putative ABC transport system ATP-binding protein